MLLLANVDEGDGLATRVFLLCGLSVSHGFLLCLDTFPELVAARPELVVVEGVQASFFEFTDELVG